MSLGTILLFLTGLLLLFGVGQRVLDRMRLTDRQALLFVALILAGGFVPDIPVGRSFAFNLGGALIPLALCVWLFFKADSVAERVRSVVASLLTGTVVFLLGRLLPDEPESMRIDPNYAYGIAAGIVACLLGRSRRCAFIAGIVGVMLANVAAWLYVRSMGVPQRLVLGGAGGYDVIVLSGFLAVLLSELVGETAERIRRGRRRPTREYKDGNFIRREADR